MKKVLTALAATILAIMVLGGGAIVQSINWNGVSHDAQASINWNGYTPNSINWNGISGSQASINWNGYQGQGGTIASINWNGVTPSASINWN